MPENDAEIVVRSIKHDKLSTEEFESCWKACSQFRLRNIQEAHSTAEILEKWPEYKLPSGYRLVILFLLQLN